MIGISFKPDSPVTIGSPSVRLIHDLLKQGRLVYTYDELEETYDNLNGREKNIKKCESVEECIGRSDVVVFMHPNNKYATLDVKGKTVVDNWGIFSPLPPVVSLSEDFDWTELE